ncbi:hypothetical protein NEPAR04_1717 [Nematocida parisii]|nr:hypothetical protein NEPAR03_0290 [Nematocida parisii]KAI5129894.1 hypothetical protein NEPAR08_1775 [Nematocida parisii]KAI5142977.1 hypothetical protein NEPAR04_1717 [Nematocida parisii]
MKERQNILKKNNIIIRNRLKNTIIILLVIKTVIYSVCAKLSEKDAELAETMEIRNWFLLRPTGGLSPTLQHMVHKNRFMENFRMYWHGIYREKSKDSGSRRNHNDLMAWKVYSIIDEDKEKNKYLNVFGDKLINMFPSVHGAYSIDSPSTGTFTWFLRMNTGNSDGLNLLASLFLLSEGVNIPIEIISDKEHARNKIIILKKKGVENEFFVNLSLIINSSAIPVYCNTVEGILAFFKRLSDPEDTLKVPEEFSMPSTYEEFLTGKFLYNPKFLIQSYVFEYIDDANTYNMFATAVHDILNEYIPTNCDNPITDADRHALVVFNQLFMGGNREYIKSLRSFNEVFETTIGQQLLEIEYTECNLMDFSKFKRVSDALKNTPFVNVIYRPSYIDGPAYINKDRQYALSYKDECCFKNCQKCILLALFLCFTFDRETKEYNIDHIPNASKELKEFFSKYTHKVSSIGSTMRSDWERVIYGLPRPEHGFSKGGSTVSTGLLHMLYTMYDLVGKGHKIKRTISYINNQFQNKYKQDKKEAKRDIKLYLEDIFISLSRNKSIDTSCLSLNPVKITKHGKSVIDMNIQFIILYTFDGLNQYGIKFTISKSYNNPLVEVVEDENIPFYGAFQVKSYYKKLSAFLDEPNPNYNIYMDPKTYPQMIIKQYTSKRYIITDPGESYEAKKTFIIKNAYETNKREIVNRKCDDPNRLMLWGSLDDLEHKSQLIKMFLIHNNRETLKINNPMVRFTSNLIRDVPMDDLKTRQCILSACVYTNNYKVYYPQLKKYDVYTMPRTEISSNGLSSLIATLPDIEVIDPTSLFNSYISLLQVYKKDKEIPYLFSDLSVIISILNKINSDVSSPVHPISKNKTESRDNESTAMDIIQPEKLCSYKQSVLNNIHKELMNAVPSPVNNNLTAIYMCWVFNIINSHYPFCMMDITLIYSRIHRHLLSHKIKDILGYKLSNKNITKFITFLEDNKPKLYDGTDAYEFEENYQAIISLFNSYTKQPEIVLCDHEEALASTLCSLFGVLERLDIRRH